MLSQKIPNSGMEEALVEKVKNSPKLMFGEYDFDFDPSNDIGEKFAEKARIDLRETPENVEEGLRCIRELLKGEPDLVVPDSDEFFKKFLRPCKWYPKSAFQLMKRFYKFKLNHPQYGANITPVNEKAPFLDGMIMPTPLRAPDGSRTVIIQGGKKWNAKKISVIQVFRAISLCVESGISEPKSQIAGVHVVFDMEGLSLGQVMQFTPSYARIVLDWVQRCLPCRVKGIHVINQPYIFNMIFAIFKPFIHEKLRNRIFFHGTNRESLFNIIDRNIFPQEYGGPLSYDIDSSSEIYLKYLMSFNDYFEERTKYGYTKKN